MVLKDFLSISGQGGLFKFISQGRNGVIVENIETKKRINVPATAKMSSLEDIAIFTDDQEVPLAEVMDKIFEKEKGGETISHKSENEALKNFMAEILPEYDKDRVYVSDMKKLIQWYNLLQKNEMLVKEEEKEEATAETAEDKEKPDNKEQEKKKVEAKKTGPTSTRKKTTAKPKAPAKKQKAENK